MTAPPTFLQLKARVSENVPLARDTYRLRLDAPELAAAVRPGQFVMLRLPGTTDPLLGRPFALFDTVLGPTGEPAAVDIGYLLYGKMTRRMTALAPGDAIEVWGPLGNGFSAAEDQGKVALVAGGIGQTPFLAYARQLLGGRGYGGAPARRLAESVAIYYGVRTADLAAGVDELRGAGAEVHLATDDGSLGFHGYVTQLVAAHPKPDRIVGCGPGPMLRSLAAVARDRGVACDISLETPMACGVGICFSCVTRVKVGDGWDYRRVCVDGPVFDAATLVWE